MLYQFTALIQQYAIGKQLITADQFELAHKNAEASDISLVHYLAKNQHMSSEDIAMAVATILEMPIVDLSAIETTESIQKIFAISLLKKYSIFPIKISDSFLELAMVDPLDFTLIHLLQFISNYFITPRLARYDDIVMSIDRLEQKMQLITNNALEHDYSVIQLINEIIQQAIQYAASDIHFEVYETYCRIRFRLDGLLLEIRKIDIKYAPKMIVRLKIMSKLDIAEKRLPQDGRIQMHLDNQKIDIRVNCCPTLWGEKIVLRILENDQQARQLEELGFNIKQLKAFKQAIQKPQGLILVTGPTGSGKTVTLYAALKILNSIEKNILTIEDPVEINLLGINQVAINTKAGLTFPIALRAFLRQDPDIIMIGEIRDSETAEIAIKAAQTGHLVLATLHTNSAFDAVNRLKHMGIAPYNLTSSLTLITAQRLARKLCQHCKIVEKIPVESAQNLGIDPQTKIYKADGCKKCVNGYTGRLAIHEVIPIKENFYEAILNVNSAKSLRMNAKQAGLTDLRTSAVEKIIQGHLSIDELYRVIQ